MKIFETGSKVNFVDENNVFVGYDLKQQCCESVGWFISPEQENKVYKEEYNPIKRKSYTEAELLPYKFDTSYFENVECNQLDEGSMVRFKLVSSENSLYLHLYNCHNGYYGHGFEAKIGGQKWKKGGL